MATVLHIDGLSREPVTHYIEGWMTLGELLKRWGATVRMEHVPDPPPKPRRLSLEAERFIDSYEREKAASVVAVFWRHHSLEAQEFDTAEEAHRFLEIGDEYGEFAGEAVVDGDQITVWD